MMMWPMAERLLAAVYWDNGREGWFLGAESEVFQSMDGIAKTEPLNRVS